MGGTLQAARNCIEGNNREVEGEREGGREKDIQVRLGRRCRCDGVGVDIMIQFGGWVCGVEFVDRTGFGRRAGTGNGRRCGGSGDEEEEPPGVLCDHRH